MSMPEAMTGEEFTNSMELVVGVATMLSAVDVGRLMGMVERADTLGPMLESDGLVLVGAVLGMAAAGLLLLVSVLSYRLPRDDDEVT